MTLALDAEFGAGGFLSREGNIHDHGAAIPQPLDDLVIAETRPIEIALRRDVRDESRDAVFLLRQVHRGEQDPNIELNVFVCRLVKIRLDEQTIGSHVLEPFPHPRAHAIVAGSLQCDMAVLQRISRSQARPNGFTRCSLGMFGHRHKNE